MVGEIKFHSSITVVYDQTTSRLVQKKGNQIKGTMGNE